MSASASECIRGIVVEIGRLYHGGSTLPPVHARSAVPGAIQPKLQPAGSGRERLCRHAVANSFAEFHYAESVLSRDCRSPAGANRIHERFDLVGKRVAFAEIELLGGDDW